MSSVEMQQMGDDASGSDSGEIVIEKSALTVEVVQRERLRNLSTQWFVSSVICILLTVVVVRSGASPRRCFRLARPLSLADCRALWPRPAA